MITIPVLVVEADLDSGSLITAKLAKRNNRKVLSVPGRINSSTSRGTLELISQGAKMVRNSKDILSVFGKGFDLPLYKSELLSNRDEKIVSLLSAEPLNLDQLSEKTKESAGELGSKVTMLLLSGRIIEVKGKYYVN